MQEINTELKQWLLSESRQDYKKFSASLVPGCNNMLGVRIPVLRKKAKELSKGDWKTFVRESEDEYFEETMIAGMVIAYSKSDITEKIEEFRRFMPRIKNWSVNDSVCSSFKLKPAERELFFDFLMEHKDSTKEFEVRVVAVLLMGQYLIPEYIGRTLEVLNELCDKEYYASMAVAWAIATAYAKFPKETLPYLKEKRKYSDETLNRTIQKMMESYRVPEEDKPMLKNMKIQNGDQL